MKKIENCVVLIIMLSSVALGQTHRISKSTRSEDILKRPVLGTNLNRVTLTSVLREAFAIATVSGGIVSMKNCNEEIRYSLMPSGSSLRDLLDAVVTADHRYKWEINESVVNLVPRAGGPQLLDQHISSFEVRNVETLDYALDQLLALPEVRKRMTELNLTEGIRGVGGTLGYLKGNGNDSDNPGFTINCKDVTLREALNTIVSAYGRAVWYYSERVRNEQNEFSIEFIVR